MKYYTVENKDKSIRKIFTIYYICMVLFCIVRIVATLGYMPDGVWGDVLFSVLIQIGILLVLPMVLYLCLMKAKPRQLFERCNFYTMNWRVVLISFGLGILCFFVNVAVSSLFNGILGFTGYRFGSSGEVDESYYSTANFFLQIILVAVLPGICEEFLHRGIVLQGIKHIGFKKAILISSLLFSLLHFNIQQCAYAFVIGLVLGFVSVVAKNIWPAIIIHFTNNFISTYLDFAANRNWVGGDILSKLQAALMSNQAVWVFIGSAFIMLIVVALMILLIWALYRQAIIRRVDNAIDKVYKSELPLEGRKIRINEKEAIRDLLESNTLLNLNYQKMDNPIDIVLPKEKSRYKPMLMDEVFMWGAVVLGGLITLFTYIWGLL